MNIEIITIIGTGVSVCIFIYSYLRNIRIELKEEIVKSESRWNDSLNRWNESLKKIDETNRRIDETNRRMDGVYHIILQRLEK